MAGKVDKPIAGLLADLKSRGLLDSHAGRMGRRVRTDTDLGRQRQRRRRQLGPRSQSIRLHIWMAGGGVRGGKVIGSTDEIGLRAVDYPVHIHDLHATMLALMGLDHEKLTYLSRVEISA